MCTYNYKHTDESQHGGPPCEVKAAKIEGQIGQSELYLS